MLVCRDMTISLREFEKLQSGFRRVFLTCIDDALVSLDGDEGRDAAVHVVRKQCKRARALLQLVESAVGQAGQCERRILRDLGRSLARARDSKVVLDVHADVTSRFRTVLADSVGAEIRQALIAEQFESYSSAADIDAVRQCLREVRSRARRWSLDSTAPGLLEHGLVKAYREARNALRRADASMLAEDFHEARKRAKTYWYELEFAARRWPQLALQRLAPARRLTEVLGQSNDLHAYCAAVQRVTGNVNEHAAQVLVALADRQRRQLELEAVELGSTVFDSKPKEFAKDLR